MGLALLVGMLLARQKHFAAHGICQSAVVLLNLIPIISFIGLAFHKTVLPAIPSGINDRFYAVATVHAALGTIAELLGLYIILGAGLKVLPNVLHLTNYKRWMRSELALWWLVIALGVGTYGIWNASSTGSSVTSRAPVDNVTSAAKPEAGKTVIVDISNFAFDPRDLQIEAGTIVIWKDSAGRHTVTADDNSFDSPILAPGDDFKQTFKQAGKVEYFCKLHGAAGGHKMAGTITVK